MSIQKGTAMDRILVATDFSPRSDRALRRAILIARQVGASLTLVHVVDGDRPERMIASEHAAALSLLEEATRTLRHDDDIAADALVEIDDVDTGVLRAAEKVGADLIILGPHRNRLRDVFVGTTVERVVRRSRFPLLVAVQPPSPPYEHTLLALDFDEASKAAGRAALEMGLFEHTDVIVMHAFDTPAEGMLRRSLDTTGAVDEYISGERRQAVEKLTDLARELGLPWSRRRVAAITGKPGRTILESARSAGAHLIVLGTNQRTGIERLLIGSVTEDVIRDAHRDVLIIPIDEG